VPGNGQIENHINTHQLNFRGECGNIFQYHALKCKLMNIINVRTFPLTAAAPSHWSSVVILEPVLYRYCMCYL